MTKALIICVALVFMVQGVRAHGNHDSGAIKPMMGGVLKSLETVHLELVQIGNEIRVYVYSTESTPKPLSAKDFPASAKAILPRGKGSENVPLKVMKDHWLANYDGKGIHRYNFEFHIKQGGHEDKITFTIEPKK